MAQIWPKNTRIPLQCDLFDKEQNACWCGFPGLLLRGNETLRLKVFQDGSFQISNLYILTFIVCGLGDGRYSLLGQPLQYSLCPPLMHGQSSYSSHQVSTDRPLHCLTPNIIQTFYM